LAQPGERGEHPLGQLPVALQVVAGHDRERRHTVLAAAAQRLGDQAERGPGRRARFEVGAHVRAGQVEVAGGVVDVVAALGNGQRHDPDVLGRHLPEDRFRVVRRIEIGHDRADHPGLVDAVWMLDDQRVQAVLRVQHLLHAAVGGHHPDAADTPVQRGALVHQQVEVHGLVRAVEAADADMHDAGRDQAAVVGRPFEPALPVRQRLGTKRFSHHTNPASTVGTGRI
jgi:hypothetical protein